MRGKATIRKDKLWAGIWGRRSPIESKGEGAVGGDIVFIVFSWSVFPERWWVQTLYANFILFTEVLHLAVPISESINSCLSIGFCERLYLSHLGNLCEPAGRGNCSRRSSSQEGRVDRALCPSNIPGDAQAGVVLLSLFSFQRLKAHWKLSSWILRQQSD